MADEKSPHRPGSGLAARFRAAIDRAHAEEKEREEEHLRRRVATRAARTQLLADLADFGRAVGHFHVSSRRDAVVFRYLARSLRFAAEGDEGEVVVTGDGLEGEFRVVLQQTLDKWTLRASPAAGRPSQRMLFDAGLELLLELAFGLEAAGDADND